MSGQAEHQQFVRPGILQSRIRDRERQAALGRGLGALLQGRQAESPEAPAPAPTVPFPALDVTGEARVAGGQLQQRGLLGRLQGLFAPEAAAGAPQPAAVAPGRAGERLPVTGAPATAEFPLADDFRVVLMDVELIHPNPFVPLSRINKEGLDRLMESIKAHGFLRPLVVMPSTMGSVMGGQTYWLISGERSWQAARIMGTKRVPVRVQQVSPREAIQMVLADDWHIQRLPAMDRANLCSILREQMGMGLDEIAERLAVPELQVEMSLRYLDLEPEIQESLERGDLTEAAVQALVRIADPQMRLAIWRYAVRYHWNAERIQRAVKARLERPTPGPDHAETKAS